MTAPDIDVFDDTYTPDGSVSSEHFEEPGVFETYGADYDHIVKMHDECPERVWTEVDGDDGIYLVSGWHFVNRIRYVITKEPCREEFEEYLVMKNSQFLNKYRCSCGEEWEDAWDCRCNDRCPKCGKEIEPYESEDLYD